MIAALRRPARSAAFALTAATCLLAAPAAARADLEIEPNSFSVTTSTEQAGGHADTTTSFAFENEGGETGGNLKTTVVDLPSGFAGDPTAVSTCTATQLKGHGGFDADCPIDSQVGTIDLVFFKQEFAPQPVPASVPVYNMVPQPGDVARLGFNISGIVSTNLAITVRPGDNGLRATSPNLSGELQVDSASLTVWGVPADPSHDPQRGRICFFGGLSCPNEGGLSSPARPAPFLSNPTQCSGEPLTARLAVNSWQQPEQDETAIAAIAPMTGCESVKFQPSLTAVPTTDSAYSPSGLNVELQIPQTWDNPSALATSHLKKAVVTLPEGMSLNPSAGSGLGVCTPGDLARERATSLPGEGCPNDSAVGTVEIETPVIAEKATGFVYVAKPFDNPFDSLLALYVVARIPARGIIVTAAGEVEPNPVTGRLITTFDDNPQLPFNRFTLKFRQGQTSPLVSPPACGSYAVQADLAPWSEPQAASKLSNSFAITHGVNGGPCPSGATPPFHPALVAGTVNNAGGTYSPFDLRLSRNDGEQELTHFSIKLPPGLIGKLAGIPFCPDAAIEAAKARTGPQGGQEELEHPSCPQASEVGHTLVGAGVGGTLAYVPGKVYLAGPYHGSAISIAAITAAKVGPFDLGTVVVREGFKINPETAEVFIDAVGSDPIPHIIEGIPVHARDIRVYADRPEFILNPTSCARTSTASTVVGSGLDFSSEADDNPITVSSPFQAADCAALPFKPKLKLSLIGGTNRGAHPKLRAQLKMHGIGEAAISRAQVTLPHSEFLENAHIKTICTRVQFAEGGGNGEKCPAGSVYGHAKAVTPILSEPLEGPIFLRSSEHRLPDLVAALHNGEIDIDLVGRIDSVKGGGIRNTFEAVPDAPVSSAVFTFQGAKKGLLVNSTNLCKGTHRAKVDFTGHNSKAYNTQPALKATCGKARLHNRRHKHAPR